MTRLTLSALILLLLALIFAIIYQQGKINKMTAELAAIQEQIASNAMSESAPTTPSNTAPEASSPQPELPPDQFRELLRLRGQVGTLRFQLAEANKMTALATTRDAAMAELTEKWDQANQALEEASIGLTNIHPYVAAETILDSKTLRYLEAKLKWDEQARFLSILTKKILLEDSSRRPHSASAVVESAMPQN